MAVATSRPDSVADLAAQVDRLVVSVRATAVEVVRETTLAIAPGEIVGLVGESGSGKTTLAMAMLWHAGRGLSLAGGDVVLAGQGMRGLSPVALSRRRGREVCYVAQDPGRALNPARRVGAHLREMLALHAGLPRGPALEFRLAEVLAEVNLPSDARFLARFPHQLSGGQMQRVALATAFACRPALVVLDEPTTGLDVQTQAHVLDTVRALCRKTGAAAIYVSHDLAVVASIADRIGVVYAGRVVELGPTADVVGTPLHPYSCGLLAAAPDPFRAHELVGIPGRAPAPHARPPGCAFEARCTLASARCRVEEPPETLDRRRSVRCWHAGERPRRLPGPPQAATRHSHRDVSLAVSGLVASHGRTPVLHHVSLGVPAGSCLALVGESGSGKTTLARCVAGMHPPSGGTVMLGGRAMAPLARGRTADQRRTIQYVFQNPYAALNPRRTIDELLMQWLDALGASSHAARRARVEAALDSVELGPDVLGRYADELSGGQQQRVALARALLSDPSFLVCDEVTSALDVSVQASIVTLLARLRREQGLGLLFITHNLALVRSIADSVVVMRHGRVVEAGPVEALFVAPSDPYTRALLRLTPSLAAQPRTDD